MSRIPLLVTALLAACDAHHHDHDHTTDHATTGATCPDGSTLTWESFGAAFMEAHCAPCHAAGLSGPARRGAPAGADLDTHAGALSVPAAHLDEAAGAGPLGVHTAMPPAGFDPQPSEEARRQLSEWIACGLP